MSKISGNKLYDILDTYTGEYIIAEFVTQSYDGTTITPDNEDTYIDGIIYRKISTGQYIKRIVPDGILNPAWFGITNDGILTPKENWDTLFKYVKNTGAPVKFAEGVYVQPYNYTYELHDVTITGVPGKTIITKATHGHSVKIPRRIDITHESPTDDGVYQVWITGPNIHMDYSELSLELDDYVQVDNGTIKKLTFDEVKALNYVTELDLTAPEPQEDGIYVAAVADWPSGGGFTNVALPWAEDVFVVMGSMVQRVNGVWSRYFPDNCTGLNFTGNFYCSGITFYDCPTFLFMPIGKGKNKTFVLEDCEFQYVRRVLAFDRIVNPNRWVNVVPHSNEDGVNFSFDTFAIRRCTFDHVHESVAWAIPTMKKLYVEDLKFTNCHNMTAGVTYMPQSNAAFYQKNLQVNSIRRNDFIDCVSRTGPNSTTIHRWFIRTLSNGDIAGNRFINTNGTTLYVSGTNCMIHDNYFEPVIEAIGGSLENIGIKAQPEDGLNMVYNNQHVGGIAPFVFQQESSETILTMNSVELSTVNRWIFSDTTELNIKNFYIVQNLEKFKELAGDGYYDDSITVGDSVYYNPRTNRWEDIQESITAAVVFNCPLQSIIRHPVRIVNNTKLVADRIFRTFSTHRFDFLEISGNKDVTVNTLFSGGMDIRKVVLTNNVIYVRGTPSLSTPIADDIEVSDNVFYRSHEAKIIIRSKNRITWRYNEVLGDTQFIGKLAELSISFPAMNEAIEFQSEQDDQIFLEYNKFSAELTRDGCVRVVSAGELVLQDNTFDHNITETTYTTRNSMVIVGATGLTRTRILRNKHILQDVAGNKIPYSFSGVTDIDWMEVNDEIVGDVSVSPTRLIDGPTLTINKLDTRRIDSRVPQIFNGTATELSSDIMDEIDDATSEDVVDKLNTLIAKLKAAGIMKAS